MVYKKYLIRGGRIPRSTLHDIRKRETRQRLALQPNCASPILNTTANNLAVSTPADTVEQHVTAECDPVLDESLLVQTLPNTDDAQGNVFPEEGTTSPTRDYQDKPDQTNSFDFSSQDKQDKDPLPPLCCHTECTADDVMLMTLCLGHRHNLPWVAMVDLLKMQNAIYGGKKIRSSKLSFMNRLLENNRLEVRNHYYCDDCSVYLTAAEASVTSIVCEYCSSTINMVKSTTYFASISFESQLKELLADEKVAESILSYRFSRSKDNEENLEDIYDGLEYKKLSSPGGVLSQPENISFSFFIDGVPVGKTKKSLWPIFVTINELPPKERQKHMLLVGLYYGPRDPDQKVFLKPFVEEVNKLSTNGVSWSHKGRKINSKVIPLIAVVDSVARCHCMNMQTFSAFYGCTFCYQKTERTAKRLKFVLPSQPAKERTRDSYERDVVKAYERRFEVKEEDQHYRGVKGPCSLSRLNYFNLFTGFVVDYMHNVLLGVTKTYFQLIFDYSRAKFWQDSDDMERFAMEDVISQIDARLLSGIRPPTCISRTPRTLKDHGNWKANEWRNWLLFYSLPCLEGILKKKHIDHLALLVKATHTLLQKSVSQNDVKEAHTLFLRFQCLYQKYFGKEYMFYNIHLLSHICKGVLRWGPIWSHNALIYESYNRQLLQLCKNPYRVVKEVCTKYVATRSIPRLIDELASTEDSVFFCESVLGQGLVRFKRTNYCLLLGAGNFVSLEDNEIQNRFGNDIDLSLCLFYQRMLVRGMRFTTSLHSGNKKNNDSVFLCSDGNMYLIQYIFRNVSKEVCVLARELILSTSSIFFGEHATVKHIQKIREYGALRLIELKDIQGQCIVMETRHGNFVSKMPFGCYGD